MEIPLLEIFFGVSVIEIEAPKVLAALLKSYPHGHFDGVLIDMYGGKLTKELESRIQSRFEQSLKDCSSFVQKSTERLSMQIRAKDLLIKEKVVDVENLRILHAQEIMNITEDLRMQYECKLRDLEKTLHARYAREIKECKTREAQYKQEKARLKEEVLNI